MLCERLQLKDQLSCRRKVVLDPITRIPIARRKHGIFTEKLFAAAALKTLFGARHPGLAGLHTPAVVTTLARKDWWPRHRLILTEFKKYLKRQRQPFDCSGV